MQPKRSNVCAVRVYGAVSFPPTRKFVRARMLEYPLKPLWHIAFVCAFVLYLCSLFNILIYLIDDTVNIMNPSPIPKFIKTNVNMSI